MTIAAPSGRAPHSESAGTSIAEEECGRGVRHMDSEGDACAPTAAKGASARSRKLPAAFFYARAAPALEDLDDTDKPRGPEPEGGLGQNKFVDIRAPCRREIRLQRVPELAM